MKALNEATRRMRIALLQKDLTPEALAPVIGLKTSSTRNILSGGPCSAATQQRITNELGVEIWHGIRPNEIRLPLKVGTIFAFPSLPAAGAFAAELGDIGEQRGREVRIAENSYMILRDKGGPSYSEEQLKEMGSKTKSSGVLEIWSAGDFPPGSAFAPNKQEISGAASGRAKADNAKKKRASKSAAAIG